MPSEDVPPVRPIPPGPTECCGAGCERCVLDIYEEKLARYEIALREWRDKHPNQEAD